MNIPRPTPSYSSMSEKIAFVGVGRMGANMARRLKECGYPIVAIYDTDLATAT
ncbi:MAG: NAD(P)-binding domain-containing protein, partial [Opitutaceae bacterium]